MIEYKLTFWVQGQKDTYLKLKFDNDNECINFITSFNLSMDNVKIREAQKQVFSYKGINPKLVLPEKYKIMYSRVGEYPRRISIKGDNDFKIQNFLKSQGFNIEVILKDTKIEL